MKSNGSVIQRCTNLNEIWSPLLAKVVLAPLTQSSWPCFVSLSIPG